jgi:YD repeat-containing protein
MTRTAKPLNYVYDKLNRLTKIIYPNGVSDNYYYNAVGNVTEFSSANRAFEREFIVIEKHKVLMRPESVMRINKNQQKA